MPEDVWIGRRRRGFVFLRLILLDDVDPMAGQLSDAERCRQKFSEVRGQIDWFEKYRGRRVTLNSGTTIDLSEEAVMRAAVKYGRAINRAVKLAAHIDAVNKKAGEGVRD